MKKKDLIRDIIEANFPGIGLSFVAIVTYGDMALYYKEPSILLVAIGFCVYGFLLCLPETIRVVKRYKKAERGAVKVVVYREEIFEIPESCKDCPMLRSDNDGHETIEFCKLKNMPNPYDNIVRYAEYKTANTLDKEKYEYFRDKNCPLEDGQTYQIRNWE